MNKIISLVALSLIGISAQAADFSPEDNACQSPCVVQDSKPAKTPNSTPSNEKAADASAKRKATGKVSA